MSKTIDPTIRGRLSVHPRGFGFIEHDDGDSSFVPPRDLNGFLAGDVVTARCLTGDDGRTSAEGLKLESRWRTELFGVARRQRGKLELEVDPRVGNSTWPLTKAPKTLKPGDYVVAALSGKRATWLRTVPREEAGLESVQVTWGIRTAFPPEVLKAAKSGKPRKASRRDLRDVPTLTIDAPSSKDLDDALAVLPPQPDGAVRVLVAIADVDAVVPEGSVLDVEARLRMTSVYLPDRVTPMLPRALSEDRLSLLPDTDRHVLAVELRIDPQGRVTAADLCEATIRSNARVSYVNAARFLDKGEADAVPAELHETLRWLRTAAARLSTVRASRGGVQTFSHDEVKLVFDGAGEPVDLVMRQENCAHRLIERLMVAANEAVGRWLADRGLPGIFRSMPEPEPDDVAQLSDFADRFGFAAGFGERLTPLGMAAFEQQFQTSDVAPAMRTVVRRALGRASYGLERAPHFALAAPLYLHFTSPIRRYADLAVHRIVKAHLRGEREQDAADPALAELCEGLNDAAYRAKKAEAARLHMLLARLFSGRIGERFAANVVMVKPFGLVVQLSGLGVTGTVSTDELPGGPWRVDAATQTLVGKKKKRFAIGQALRVEVLSTDEPQGRIEFKPCK